MLLFSMTRFFKFLPAEQRQAFLGGLSEEHMSSIGAKPVRLRLGSDLVREAATAGPASLWLAVSIVWQDVELGGSPQTVSQPLWR
jgi:hypothetical protein